MADDRNRQQIVKIPERAVTFWRPDRALPILGTATVLWAGRRVLRYVFTQRRLSLSRMIQKTPQPRMQDQQPTGYTVIYHYQARWTVRVQPEDET